MGVSSSFLRCTPLKSTIIDVSPANTAATENYVNSMYLFTIFGLDDERDIQTSNL